MSQIVTLTGMVLSASPVGEYDRRVVILTKERGKISAFAKGARRPQSHLAGVTAPCSFGVFSMFEGRTSYTIQSADISNYFAELRTDVEAAYYARESNDEREMLKLLYQSMRALTKRLIPLRLVRYIFELKAVSINGEGPQVFQCVSCGSTEKSLLFSAKKGGIVCSACSRSVYDIIKLNSSTLYAMQYVETSSIEKLFAFTLSDEVLDEFGKVMERYLDVYVEKRFKSLEILEQIAGI